MDYLELGALLRQIRKYDLRLTQNGFTEATGIEVKKVGRIETGRQLPDADYLEAMESLGIDTSEIREIIDDIKRRALILNNGNLSFSTETMPDDIQQLKKIVVTNNLLLRQIYEKQKELIELIKEMKSKNKQDDLLSIKNHSDGSLEMALRPIDF